MINHLQKGTNYGFSAWAPQFAQRLQLTATQTNLIGNFGNIGMYAMGVPGGILIDSRGPRWGVALGCVCLALGYFSLKTAYDGGPGSMGMPLLCLFSLTTGMGSCTAFSAAIKASANNWPTHRGTATAFPLSAFGLSAFFYTGIASVAFPGDTSGYLKLLAYGTTIMTFVGMLFLQMVDTKPQHDHVTAYGVVPQDDEHQRSKRPDQKGNRMHRTDARSSRKLHGGRPGSTKSIFNNNEENESLAPSSNSSGPGDIDDDIADAKREERSLHRPEVTGWALLREQKFWQLFIMLALLCGVGLMTINNIGNNASSLWQHYDDSASKDFILRRQLVHVSILSLCSFFGRLCSGIGSDWLIHHNASRFWTLAASANIFVIAQVIALTLENPNHLYWLSGCTGYAYGVLFGVYPALVADAFGASGLGINWGAMTWAPVLSGNIYNLCYGSILDKHSEFKNMPGGDGGSERVCIEGKECFASAYWVTLCSSVVGVVWSVWCIRQEKLHYLREQRDRARSHQP